MATQGLLKWIKGADIQPEVKGSDHCPVYIDFHDSITTEAGEVLDFWQLTNPPGRTRDGPVPVAPPFAAKYYEEFKNTSLKSLA